MGLHPARHELRLVGGEVPFGFAPEDDLAARVFDQRSTATPVAVSALFCHDRQLNNNARLKSSIRRGAEDSAAWAWKAPSPSLAARAQSQTTGFVAAVVVMVFVDAGANRDRSIGATWLDMFREPV